MPVAAFAAAGICQMVSFQRPVGTFSLLVRSMCVQCPVEHVDGNESVCAHLLWDILL